MKCAYLNKPAGDGFAVIPENKNYRFQFIIYTKGFILRKRL